LQTLALPLGYGAQLCPYFLRRISFRVHT